MLSETFFYIILVIILLFITLIFFIKTPKKERTLNHALKENEKWLENRINDPDPRVRSMNLI